MVFKNRKEDPDGPIHNNPNTINTMVGRRNNTCELIGWIQDINPGSFQRNSFKKDTLAWQRCYLSVQRNKGNRYATKISQENPVLWDTYIFNIGICPKRLHTWIGMNKNTRIVPLTCMGILPDITLGPGVNPIEGITFE